MTKTKQNKEVGLDGKPLGRNLRRCRQTQCGYFLQGNCKACESCSAEPFVIDTTCARCLRCESVPEELRFGDPKKGLSDQEKEMIKKIIHAHVEELQRRGIPIKVIK